MARNGSRRHGTRPQSLRTHRWILERQRQSRAASSGPRGAIETPDGKCPFRHSSASLRETFSECAPMAVTKSWDTGLALQLEAERKSKPLERRREFLWLAAASLVIACGLAFVLLMKTQDFSDLENRLQNGELLNLNTVSGPRDLLPALEIFPTPEEREAVAERIWSYVDQHRPLPNTGAIARLHLPLAKLKP